MNNSYHSMNKILHTIASAMVVFAMVTSAFAIPLSTAVAETLLDDQFSFDTDLDLDFDSILNPIDTSDDQSGESISVSESSFTECVLEASSNLVTTGDSVTLDWSTTGFTDITINGEPVSGTSGSKTITNLQETTTFTLQALNDSGSSCVQQVVVGCVPPEEPKICDLEVLKTVNKSTAIPGDNLTYTITVKNKGDANCTGGVKIEDVLDQKLSFVSANPSSNVTAGYGGGPVYTSSNRTLHFDGGVLEPNETGTISVITEIQEPAQCGDFEVKNRANATAAELDNFQTSVYSQIVTTAVDNDCVVPNPPVCTLAPSSQTVGQGGSAVLTWTTDYATAVTLTEFGSVELDGTGTTEALQTNKTYTLTATGPGGQATCVADVIVTQEPPAPTCTLMPVTQTISQGESATLTWTTTNADTVTLTEFGSVAKNGTDNTAALFADKTYSLVATGNGKTVSCDAEVVVQTAPVPTCDSFTANPSSIMVGASTTLSWETSNAVQVFLNNGVGAVAQDDSIQVSPLADIVYKLTLVGELNQSVSCEVPVTVSEDPVPVCDLFTATPNQLSAGGGSVELNWEVSQADTVTISPVIGAVGLNGSQSTNVTQSTTFTLTAIDDNGDEVSCVAPVTVADTEPALTCADNVSFTASDTSITRGSNTTLTWSTTDVDAVSISVINNTSLSGSQTVSPSDDQTYVLTATRGSESVICPVSVNVSSGGGGGGGGGGSSSPRCELTISDSKISAGEQITLEWDTSRATEVTLTDDRGKVLFTTDDFLASEKNDYYDSSIRLKPTRSTEYTLLAERGSRDEECTVKVELDDSVVFLQSRDQQPLVAGISLSQVPYTGFEAGPFMTVMFYALLVAWSLYITYLLLFRKRVAGDMPIKLVSPSTDTESVTAMKKSETVRPDVFVESVTAATPTHVAPTNLPTGAFVVGYENHVEKEVNPHQVDDKVITGIENRAHEQKALLSSDAVRHFVGTTSGTVERNEALDAVIAEAKKTYPLEDDWIVINESRMRNLCKTCQSAEANSAEETFVPATVPEGTGSLAEAVVTGNVVAAYKMIGNRPMFALADAAADLDAVYRNRRGEDTKISDLLAAESKRLSDEQIKNMIAALTSALDGTYTDEASAVKMAIMKAVKEAAQRVV